MRRSRLGVVNSYLARKLWPGEDPIGQTLTLGGEKGIATVIGVVRNGKYRTLGESPSSAVYLGCLPAQRTLVVRTAGDDRRCSPSCAAKCPRSIR